MENKGRLHYAWVILISCCLLIAGGQGAIGYSSGIFYVPVGRELGVGRGAMVTYASIQNICMAMTVPFAGKLLPGKNCGKKIALAAAGVAAGFALLSFGTALWHWYAIGAFIGVCSAFVFMFPTPLLINNWFADKAGSVMGIAIMFSGLSASIITPFGTSIILQYGWRTAYRVIGLISAILIIPAAFLFIRYQPSDMGLEPYGAEKAKQRALAAASPEKAGIPAGIALKSRSFPALFIAAGLMGVTSAYVQHFAAFADSIGFTPMMGARLASTMMIGTILEKLTIGTLSDRFGAVKATLAAYSALAVGFLGFCIFRQIPLIFACAFLGGFGPAILTMSPSLLTRKIFGQTDYPKIFSYISIATSLVGAFGGSTIGFLYDLYGSYVPAFLLGVALCFISSALSVLAVKAAPDRRPDCISPAS